MIGAGHRVDACASVPAGPDGDCEAERAAFAVTVGSDGFAVLDAVATEAGRDNGWTWLAKVPTVALLARVWEQLYVRDRRHAVRQHTGKELPPGAQRIISPYDPDARVGIKRSTRWDGYKLHLTETCDADGTTPHLITHVVTMAAPVDDAAQTLTVERDLIAAGRGPTEHLVDAGYMGAELIVEAAHLGIGLLGPVPIAGAARNAKGVFMGWATSPSTGTRAPRPAHRARPAPAGSTRRSMVIHESTSTSTTPAARPAQPNPTAPKPATAA